MYKQYKIAGAEYAPKDMPTLSYVGQQNVLPSAARGESMCPTNGKCPVCTRRCCQWKM